MVQPRQDWDSDNGAGPLHCPTCGRVFAKRQVRAGRRVGLERLEGEVLFGACQGSVARFSGAIVVNLPGGEIVPTLKSGAIDGSEWVGPWLDMALGLHTVASYYYYPGFHEPSAGQTLGINKRVWESFDTSERQLTSLLVR